MCRKPGKPIGGNRATEKYVWCARRLGICDVTTLGKIDVQRPTAAQFLDFVYNGKMSMLKPKSVRYGLMLRKTAA